VAIDSH